MPTAERVPTLRLTYPNASAGAAAGAARVGSDSPVRPSGFRTCRGSGFEGRYRRTSRFARAPHRRGARPRRVGTGYEINRGSPRSGGEPDRSSQRSSPLGPLPPAVAAYAAGGPECAAVRTAERTPTRRRGARRNQQSRSPRSRVVCALVRRMETARTGCERATGHSRQSAGRPSTDLAPGHRLAPIRPDRSCRRTRLVDPTIVVAIVRGPTATCATGSTR